MTSIKTASFVLPTRNVERYIGPLLSSIFSQQYDGSIEVLIIDSSDDRTPEIVRDFPVRYMWLEPDDYNYGRTRNQGAALASGEFLIFLSTDIHIRDNAWLTKLTRHFADPNVAGVYGRQIPKEDATPMEQFFIGRTYPPTSLVLEMEGGGINLKRGPVLFSNVNSAVRRSAWEKIKLPEMLKGEEVEWARRALTAGHKIVYDSDAAVFHSHRYTLGSVFREYFDSGATMHVTKHSDALDYSNTDFIRDGLRHVMGEFMFMLKNGHWRWMPYAVVYDLMKSLGYLLGSGQEYMPLWMKRVLGKKKDHWDRYDTVIEEPD